MVTLEQALSSHQLLTLRVIGEWWDLDLTGQSKEACVEALTAALAGLDMATEASYLGPEEAEAFNDLIRSGGRVPVAAYERQHGTVRLMGPGRMEREEPWLDPVSPAEGLWYRGFLYRAFDESDASQLVEFYCLPDELFAQFRRPPTSEVSGAPQQDQGLTPVGPPDLFQAASSDAVDDLTALLCFSQNTPLQAESLVRLEPLLLRPEPERRSLLLRLAWELELLRKTEEGARPARAAVDWLRQGREAQLRSLADTWSRSAWNDLRHTPGLAFEGSGWANDPILARTALLEALPRATDWLRLEDLIFLIKERDPDFQRPDGNYETWYIRDLATGDYVTGFDNWEQVEGRLLRFMVTGPLAWLGLVDLAEAGVGADEDLFRPTPRLIDWLQNRPLPTSEVSVPIVVQADASLLVPFNANRYHRFQVARVAEAERVIPGKPFQYRLTPTSLERAQEQGIGLERLLRFLDKASGRPVPASAKRAMERWSDKGTEARLEKAVILRVRDAEILEKLRANPKTRPYLGEALGELAAVVLPGQWPKLRQAAAQLGLLLDHQGG